MQKNHIGNNMASSSLSAFENILMRSFIGQGLLQFFFRD